MLRKSFARAYVKRPSQLGDAFHADIALTTLNAADVVAVQMGAEPQFLLGPAPPLAEGPKPPPNLGFGSIPTAHGEKLKDLHL